jgi:hypothetical protein
LVAANANGDVDWVVPFGDDGERIQSIWPTSGGVLVHSISADDPQLNFMSRWTDAGDRVWIYAVGGAVTHNHVDSVLNVILFGRTQVLGGDQLEVITRLDLDTGLVVWEWDAPLDVNRETSTFRADGGYLWRGINLHTAQSHLFSFNLDTGTQEYSRAPASTGAGGFSPPGYDLREVKSLTAEGDVVVSARRPNGVIEGQSVSAVYRVASDGQVTAVYNSDPAIVRGNQLIAPGIQGLTALHGSVAIALHAGATGLSQLALLDEGLDLQWMMNIPNGLQVDRIMMVAPGALDVRVTSADEGESVLPVVTRDGQGYYPWRIHSPQASLGGYVGTETSLFALLNNDNQVDVVRIPRD